MRATFAQERWDGFALAPLGTHDYAKSVEQDHGRREIRRHWTLDDPAIIAHLDPAGAWSHLRVIGLVKRERHVGDRVTVERHHYLLSAPFSAAAFAAAVRSHWTIENGLHTPGQHFGGHILVALVADRAALLGRNGVAARHIHRPTV